MSYLDADQDGVCLACYSHNHRTLLDCLGGIFDLEYPTLRRAVWRETKSAGVASSRDGLRRVCGLQCDRVVVVVVSEHFECPVT